MACFYSIFSQPVSHRFQLFPTILKAAHSHLLSAPFPPPDCLMSPAPLNSSSQERKPNCPSCHDIYSVSAVLYVLCKDILRMKNEYMIQCLHRGLRGPLVVVAVPPKELGQTGFPQRDPGWTLTIHVHVHR